MTYLWLNCVFLAIAFVFFVVSMALIGRQMRRAAANRVGAAVDGYAEPTVQTAGRQARGRALLVKYGITLIALLILTAVFDNVIIGLGIVAYDPSRISGVYVGLAPLEDFAYSVAAVLILPTLWGLLGHLRRKK